MNNGGTMGGTGGSYPSSRQGHFLIPAHLVRNVRVGVRNLWIDDEMGLATKSWCKLMASLPPPQSNVQAATKHESGETSFVLSLHLMVDFHLQKMFRFSADRNRLEQKRSWACSRVT